MARGVVTFRGCSTPSGITATNGQFAQSLADAALPVLNAFRHHGDERPIRGGASEPEPEVLNAFRHHGDERPFD